MSSDLRPSPVTTMDRLDELRHRYADSLPQKGRELEELWTAWLAALDVRSRLLALHQLAHRLSGSAPAYGFDRIGALAQRVDAMIGEWLDPRDGERSSSAQLRADLDEDMQALLRELAG